MKKKYKTLKYYLPDILEKMNQKDIQYEKCLQGFCVKGQENMKNLKGLLAEYKKFIDLPKESWEFLNISTPPNGYEWSFKVSEMGVDGRGYPFQRFIAKKK